MVHVGGRPGARVLVLEPFFLNAPGMISRVTSVLLAAAVPLLAADWPQFLGPARDGSYSGGDLASTWPKSGPRQIWQHELGSGWSGPAVADGRVIIFHRVVDEEIVECLQLDSGKSVWKTSFATAYVDGFGFDNGPRATPLIVGSRVFLLGANGNLHCVDLTTGKALWSRDLKASFRAPTGYFGFACSPLVVNQTLLLNVGGSRGAGIVAFDTADGKTRWQSTDDEASYSSPVIANLDGTTQSVFFTRHNLFGIDTRNGRELWKRPWSPAMQASVSAAVPLIAGDVVFATASYGAGAIALRVKGNKLTRLWENDESLSCQYHTPLLHEAHLYGFHGRLDTGPRPEFRCVELTTGRVRWSSSRADAGALIRVGGEALLLTVNGELIHLSLSPKNYREIARAQILGLEVRAHPALADGRFLARDKRRLVCVDLR